MPVTQYKFFSFNGEATYKKFDVILDSSIPRYYYATQDNKNQNPNAFYSYGVTALERKDDVISVFYFKTGVGPDFAVGSLIETAGLSFSEASYKGMVVEAGPSYVKYINAGIDTGIVANAGTIVSVTNPAWTTGFFFVPTYGTNYEVQNKVLNVQFGDGYSQRQRDGLNSNSFIMTQSFENRTDKETKAILNFVQDKAGVTPFKVLMPVSTLNNDPDLEYVGTNPRVSTTSFGLNSTTLTLTQVFDRVAPGGGGE